MQFNRLLFPKFIAPAVLAFAMLGGCNRAHITHGDYAYVSATQAFLRDRVSAVYNKVGTVQNGEKVEIVGKDRRFVKVRTASGLEGYLEQKNLVDDSVYEQLADLGKKYANAPAQARGVVRNEVNMHVTPARDSDKLFQLHENDKVELLQRAIQFKNAVTKETKPKAAPPTKTADAKNGKPEVRQAAEKTPAPVATPAKPQPVVDLGPPEDWWLVRDQNHRVGWILGRMLDVDVPMEVAQYAEGKRVVAAFVVTTVEDPESDKPNHQVPYYLMLTNEPHDGQPQDFNAIRVFTWNVKKHRYETAYRERDLSGVLPVNVGQENFDKLGVEPTFTIRTKDEAGAVHEKKYRMEGVLVRRVYAAGEQPEPKPQRKTIAAARKHRRR
jgi:Bacterial SH3 domain